MNWPVFSLFAFALWTLAVLVGGVGAYRWSQIFAGRAGIAEWPADSPHGPSLYRRAMRAHANCVENLPVFAALVLVAELAAVHSPLIDALAVGVVVARIGQSLIHIASGSAPAVAVRFAFFLAQVLSFAAMAAAIAAGGGLPFA